MNFYPKRFTLSLKNALFGFSYLLKNEKNFRIQVFFALIVVILMFVFPTRKYEKSLLVIVVMTVLILEMLNTVFERLADMLKPRLHFYVKEIKNIMAAAVLVSSMAAIVIGLIIFIPYFQDLLK